LQEELVAVKSRTATRAVQVEFNASERKTKRLMIAEHVAKRFGDRILVKDLNLTLAAGMRLGILGPNGSGKTTLMRMLAGLEPADAGVVQRADGLRLVYLDQHREQIDPAVTLRRALAPDGDQVIYRDRPIHVAGWARRFLFPAEQLEMPLGRLSGGERARVSIARLMLQPADVLMLDEPTNDLDIPTLEVLEESLLEFPGAVVLVTHDRYLFDRVSTTVLALDGTGASETFADYQQWEEAQRTQAQAMTKAIKVAAKAAADSTKRLSYKEKREWEQMEGLILAAETALEASKAATHDPSIASDAAALRERYAALQAAQDDVDRLYARWAELEEKQRA
jgi:ABC transport system ATP-binding/permease protein